ncbi:flagellar export chaperone FliS [Nitrincola tapanii]|uniref:Flagellar secretion chaperone FliS n=1 Tax=Nitrincola tapanii TaxID=1708751 RepID=A0A5A9W7Y9_9GAMM|nr:flagellar export chaperone FliS [Nitrincola tapanii]KAA0876594.1 flagellar export chaperone FliS [Nitrincola tapanii]
MIANALKQYKSVDLQATVQTASPHKLISMLLAGALEAYAKGKGAAERKDFEARANHLNKAMEIVLGLKSCLDMDQGGEVSENLDRLYDYILMNTLTASRNNDAELIQELIGLLLEVKEGWDEMPLEFRQ